MSNLDFRSPTAEEVEVKAVVKNTQIELTLYCRAETCTKILNETVGPLGWEKEYTNNNKNCIVRIWDDQKQRMISKEDCGGGPTDLDGLKGQASNGFKRVCALGWGLGIELYSQPDIYIPQTDDNSTIDKLGNPIVAENYVVDTIEFENKKISKLVIKDGHGNIVYPLDMATKSPSVQNTDVNDVNVAESTPFDEEIDDLPDNTDGFEEPTIDYAEYASIINSEIERTHVRRADVYKAMKIDDLNKLEEIDEQTIKDTIERLKGMKTYIKKVL